MSMRGQLYRLAALSTGTEWRRFLAEAEASAQNRNWGSYLERAIDHALTRVPYYKSLGLPRTAELSAFPLLTRRALRENFTTLQDTGASAGPVTKTCTGGSTGEPVWIVHDRLARQWDYAAEMYFISVLLGMPIPYYLSHPRVVMWHTRARQRRLLSATHWASRLLKQVTFIEPYAVSSEETLLERLQVINRIRPVVIWAFASPLYELARLAKRRNVRVHSPQLVITSVEMLYPTMRNTIQEVFSCPVRDCYGAVEVRRVAAECSHGSMHVLSFNAHVEVLSPEGRSASPGEEGRLVVTPLHNHAMPLLRYEIGDMARVGRGDCPCGSELPVLEGLTGRVIEHFVTADNKLVYGGLFVAMFYNHDWIWEFQVLQQDVNVITVYFKRVPGRDVPPEALRQLSTTIREVMGRACKIEWREVSAVPRTPIGKHLHVRSLVWEERERRIIGTA